MTTAVDPHGLWELERRLNEIAGDVEKPGYYLMSGGVEDWEGTGDGMHLHIDGSSLFCEPCIDLIRSLIGRQFGLSDETKDCEDNLGQTEEIEAGGMIGAESETSNFCHWCCQKLETCFSEYGVAEEMRHYEEHPPAIPLRPADACDLSNTLQGLYQHDPVAIEFVSKVRGWLADHDEAVSKEEVTTE